MTDIALWKDIVTFVEAGGTTALLIAIIIAFFAGKLVTGSAYQALLQDRDEWRAAYRAVADVALRQALDRRS